jgi:hypothetical protein
MTFAGKNLALFIQHRDDALSRDLIYGRVGNLASISFIHQCQMNHRGLG